MILTHAHPRPENGFDRIELANDIHKMIRVGTPTAPGSGWDSVSLAKENRG